LAEPLGKVGVKPEGGAAKKKGGKMPGSNSKSHIWRGKGKEETCPTGWKQSKRMEIGQQGGGMGRKRAANSIIGLKKGGKKGRGLGGGPGLGEGIGGKWPTEGPGRDHEKGGKMKGKPLDGARCRC